MSWPPRDHSSGQQPIYRPPGLLSSEAITEQQARDRPRLPPLSSLFAASSSSSSSNAPPSGSYTGHSSSTSSRTERSPLVSHNTIPLSNRSPNLDRHSTAQSLSSFYRRPPPHPQRSSSTSSVFMPVNLPPLTSLSLGSRASRSPPSSTYLQRGGDLLPPRLPSTSYSSTARRRPSQGQSDLSISTSTSSAGAGPIRRRMTSTVPMTGPYRRHSPVYDQEYFGNVWDIYTYACRANDETSPRGPQSYPSIANGDVQSLLYHLHGELDRLERRNPRLSNQLAQDAGLINKRQASTSSSSSSSIQRAATSSGKASGEMRSEQHHHDEKRTPSDDTEMSSSQGSFTSPPIIPIYTSGLPGFAPNESSSSHHHHHQQQNREQQRRMSASTSSVIGRSLTNSSSQQISSNSAVSTLPPPKRVRKRKDETDQSCLCCSATETPEWRKGPTGPRTLCNACGLLFAKQCRKKELEAQARGERPRGSRPQGPEVMNEEERQKSLAELKVAVNARVNASPPI